MLNVKSDQEKEVVKRIESPIPFDLKKSLDELKLDDSELFALPMKASRAFAH